MSAHELCPDCGEPQEFDPPEHVCRSHYCAAKLEAKVARLHDAVVEEQRLCALKLKSVHEEVARLREELEQERMRTKLTALGRDWWIQQAAKARELLDPEKATIENASHVTLTEKGKPVCDICKGTGKLLKLDEHDGELENLGEVPCPFCEEGKR